MKAFISHSWAQKEFVTLVGNNVGRDIIIEDKYNFDSGKLEDEIIEAITSSDVFVSLISDASLDSKMAQFELSTACSRIMSDEMDFIAFIIDDSISVEDPRIPKWIIKYRIVKLPSPKLVGKIIRESINGMVWKQSYGVFAKAEATIFVGRGEELDNLHSEWVGAEGNTIRSIIVSGIPYIGRKRFLKEFFKQRIEPNAKSTQEPIIIKLSASEQADALVLQLNEYTRLYSDFDLRRKLSEGSNEQIKICVEQLNCLAEFHQFVVIDDNQSIITRDKDVAIWFATLVANEDLLPKIHLFIASFFAPKIGKERLYKQILFTQLHSLPNNDAKTLFHAYAKALDVPCSENVVNEFLRAYSGYPEQIIGCVKDIKKSGIAYAKRFIEANANMHQGLYADLLNLIKENPQRLQVLIGLSLLGMASSSILQKIFTDIDVIEILCDLSSFSVVSQVGANKEYFTVHPSLADYIQRDRMVLQDSYVKNLESLKQQLVNELVSNEELDASEHIIAIKEQIRNNISNIETSIMLPSYVQNVIMEEYHAKNYTNVIKLANWMLYETNNYKYVDYLKSVRYWLCLAYCKEHNVEKLNKEIEYFWKERAMYTYHFLKGFSYRQNGRLRDAMREYLTALEGKEEDASVYLSKARQELVIVYTKLNMYSEALKLAKENYDRRPSNPYYIEAYFRTLVASENPDVSILQELMSNMEKSFDKHKDILLKTFKVEYAYYIEKKPFEDTCNQLKYLLHSDYSNYRVYTLDALHKICEQNQRLDIYKTEKAGVQEIEEDLIFEI